MKHHLPFLLLFLSIGLTVQAQKITGKVTAAEDGLPLPGVNVLIKNTSEGTITEIDGTYELVAGKGATLEFSFVGLFLVSNR